MLEQSFQQALFADDDFRRSVHHLQDGRLLVGHTGETDFHDVVSFLIRYGRDGCRSAGWRAVPCSSLPVLLRSVARVLVCLFFHINFQIPTDSSPTDNTIPSVPSVPGAYLLPQPSPCPVPQSCPHVSQCSTGAPRPPPSYLGKTHSSVP